MVDKADAAVVKSVGLCSSSFAAQRSYTPRMAPAAQPGSLPFSPLPSMPPMQEARALESKQRQLQAALDRAQREGRALNGQQERVAALGVQLAEAQVRATKYSLQ